MLVVKLLHLAKPHIDFLILSDMTVGETASQEEELIVQVDVSEIKVSHLL